jgi:hypothetical protein
VAALAFFHTEAMAHFMRSTLAAVTGGEWRKDVGDE